MAYNKVLFTIDNGVARISLNDPTTLNAMSAEMGAELLDALGQVEGKARCVLLTGEGKSFSSGANLSEGGFDLEDSNRDVGARLEPIFNPIVLAMKNLSIPVVTAFRGPAAGVGCAIAMAGDIILCSDKAYFLQAFRRIGLAPDGGSSWLLTKAVGRVRAMQMMMLGERLPAAQACDWGLVTKVFPDDEFDAEVMKLATELANGPASIGIIKQVAWSAVDAPIESAMAIERNSQREAGRTEDFVEGVMAFRGKRPANFTGK